MRASSSQVQSDPGRVLLVDDNKLGLAARKAVLEEQGLSVATATHGQEALDLFARGAYDVVVTDYKMPKMNGVELIAELRHRSKSLPIILLSGYTDALGLNETNTGADLVIAKSANEVGQLLRAVQRLLRRAAAAEKKPPGSHRSAQARRAAT